MTALRGGVNLGEDISDKIKFISPIDFFLEPRNGVRLKIKTLTKLQNKEVSAQADLKIDPNRLRH